MTYAIAESISPRTGDPLWDETRNTWALSPSPATERVVIALRTQLGACPVDPTLGVDWASVDKLRTDATTRAEAAIRAGLKCYVDDGSIARLAIRVEVYPARQAILFDVSFTDVRLGTTQRVTGQA